MNCRSNTNGWPVKLSGTHMGMGVIDILRVPVIAAPMAGGPSTPELVNAVSAAGGFGFLAAGYISSQRLAENMCATRGPYGVNLFAPQKVPKDLAPVEEYVRKLDKEFERAGVHPGDFRTVDVADGWDEKLELIYKAAAEGWGPAVVSVTFGLPSAAEIRRLKAAGIEVWGSVTNIDAAREAVGRGVDTLVVQGPEAGGHRATFTTEETPSEVPLRELVEQMPEVPLVAAGGIINAEPLSWPGVQAIACGTAFLLANEAGTGAWQRELIKGAVRTATTRAFSGRVARGVETKFMANHMDAPAVYPHVNSMMGPLRAAAPEYAAAWAGCGVSSIVEAPAAVIVERLMGSR